MWDAAEVTGGAQATRFQSQKDREGGCHRITQNVNCVFKHI